jgi:hypothetical protein
MNAGRRTFADWEKYLPPEDYIPPSKTTTTTKRKQPGERGGGEEDDEGWLPFYGEEGVIEDDGIDTHRRHDKESLFAEVDRPPINLVSFFFLLIFGHEKKNALVELQLLKSAGIHTDARVLPLLTWCSSYFQYRLACFQQQTRSLDLDRLLDQVGEMSTSFRVIEVIPAGVVSVGIKSLLLNQIVVRSG